MKYLYLTFSDPEVVNLDQWVFGTESHPFLVQCGIGAIDDSVIEGQCKVCAGADGDRVFAIDARERTSEEGPVYFNQPRMGAQSGFAPSRPF